MSKTQVTKEVESKSQLKILQVFGGIGCQRPKLLKKLKANHNGQLKDAINDADVKDPSY